MPPDLSRDSAMQAAYALRRSLPCVRQTGWRHPTRRHQANSRRQSASCIKTCALGVLYGMEVEAASPCASDSRRSSPATCYGLIAKPIASFWRWSDAVPSTSPCFTGSLHTVFGWHVHVGENPNPRSLRNFPMQGQRRRNAASRVLPSRPSVAIEVCAPVHDAVLICAPLDRLDDEVARMRACMARGFARRARRL